MVTAAGFKLKGTGWYETDFKTKTKKPAEKVTKKT
jgi:predicted nucleic acid-binding Zn ribbon protein